VTASVAAESPAAISVLGRPALARIPGVNADDRLRLVPGFTLLRRSSSLAANPTTQGVSLRGIGSSGASRTLVLFDGIPLTDPFGGWVYWTRADAEELDRVELSRGATTSAFGDRAMGGSIHLISRPPQARWSLGIEGGNKATLLPSGSYSNLFKQTWGITASMRAFSTDGYYIVPTSIRNRVDTPAGVKFVAPQFKLDWITPGQRLALKSDVLVEERQNGTAAVHNSTSLGSMSANYSRPGVNLLAFHQRQEYRAAFSAIAADRLTERITSRQSVPAEATGGAAYSDIRRGPWRLLGGADFLRVEGVSRDWLVPSGARIGGGSQFQRGAFAQGDVRWKSLSLYGGSRYHWTGMQGTGTTGFYSPSGGFRFGRRRLAIRGSAYRAFRAPTLNELYREFRAGNTVTLANANLRPEKLFGAEVGADLIGERARFSVTLYRNDLSELIANATLSATPTLVTRERRNIGAALARGIEADFRYRWNAWFFDTSYLFADSRVATRERIPQIPRHQGNAQLAWMRGGTQIAGGIRASGLQFEDDRNTQRLPGFAVAHIALRQSVPGGMAFTLAIENALDREFLSGFTPQPQIGAPRLWRVGVRYSSPPN
jgi:outer membrane cobalamin receptor